MHRSKTNNPLQTSSPKKSKIADHHGKIVDLDLNTIFNYFPFRFQQQLVGLALSVFLPAITNLIDLQIWYSLQIKGGGKNFRNHLPSLLFNIHSSKGSCILVFEEKKITVFSKIL